MNIAIYTNILTPYRKYFYDSLYNECQRNGDEFHVLLMAETEPNRNWKYEDFKTEYTILLNSKTITVGNAYIHFNNNLRTVLQELDIDILICAGSYLCPGIWDVLRWKETYGYIVYYWSESHLNEKRNYHGIKVKIREWLRKHTYRKFDGFWYAGQMSLEFIKKYAKQDCKLFFMPNLVEESKYYAASKVSNDRKDQLRKTLGIGNEKIVFICPARLTSVKGIDKFIPILGQCKNKDKAVVLVAGDGELKEQIEVESKIAGIDMRLLGFQNQESVIELYSLSDIFLLPSLSDPNPLTCIESLWAGLPLYISEHCGNYPEVVKQGENGYVFSYNNGKQAIDDLTMIIDSSNQWKINAKNTSLTIAKDKYDSKKVVHNVIKYFHGVIAKK